MFTTIGILIFVSLIGLYFYNQSQFKKAETAYPPKGDFIEVDGIKLHYLSKGSGKPVVFLHGGVLSSEDFYEVIELVAANGYKAIAFDRLGYGYSERPSNEEVSPVTQARYIHRALIDSI